MEGRRKERKTIDPTEQQTAEGLSTSKKLSMQATTPPANVPGYRLTQFLGAGAFGQVWVGRDLNTGRDVAVTDIATADYPTAATRPLNSRLACDTLARDHGIARPDWHAGLADVLKELT